MASSLSLSSPWLAAWPHHCPMGVVIVFIMGDVVAVIVNAFAMEMSSSSPWSSCRHRPMDVVLCAGGRGRVVREGGGLGCVHVGG